MPALRRPCLLNNTQMRNDAGSNANKCLRAKSNVKPISLIHHVSTDLDDTLVLQSIIPESIKSSMSNTWRPRTDVRNGDNKSTRPQLSVLLP